MKKIIKKVSTILSAVIILACSGVFVLFGISGTGWKALTIPTDSMRPDMPPGTLVLVHSVPAATLKVGDVITYINPLDTKTTITHRIIKKYLVDNKIPAFVTKGDANKIADIPITEGSIEGKVVWHVPHAGYWLLDSKRPIIILPITYVVALIIMADEVIRLRDYFKLRQPYVLSGYKVKKKQPKGLGNRLVLGFSLTIAFVMIIAAAGPTAFALLRSNTVALANNRLAVATNINKCTTNTSNSNSVTVTNNNSQTATTGNASGNGGNATSGNATNNSSTNINITLTNC